MLESRVNPFRAVVAGAIVLLMASCSSSPPQKSVERRVTTADLTRDLENARTALTPVVRSVAVTPSLPQPEHPSVEAAIRYFSTDRRTTIQSSLNRSAEFREMVESVIAEHGLPREIAYLPVIESGFRTGLTSRAGAHGMWQFMPPTAREYELRVDWWVDERADPLLATHAAAVYLKRLYRMFDDWPLALAAYNAGPGRVSRTMKETGARTFWELLDMKRLPKETRGYVPTFFATAAIVTDPERYGFELPPPLPPAHDLEEVIVTGPVSLEFISRKTGADAAVLSSQNLAFHREILPPGQSVLRAPRSKVNEIARYSSQWHRLDENLGVSLLRVNSSDSVITLAARLAVDPDDIRGMNGLKRNEVASGSELWIPLSRRELRRRASNPSLSRATTRDRSHVVSRGDTLYSLARANGTTVDRLRARNGLDEDTPITPGDVIFLD